MLPTTPTTLADLAAAQQARPLAAFTLSDSLDSLARQRRAYARKRAELAAVQELSDETTPDLLLRAADGRQLALRLAGGDMQQVLGLLCRLLRKELLDLETDIVDHLLSTQSATPDPDQQLRTLILALCAPGDPALPQPPAPGSVWLSRADAAETLEEQLQQQHGNDCAYGREIMWHPLFPAEYVACVSKLPLHEVIEFQEALDSSFNQRRPLDSHDYAYLRDVLNEALASQPTELAALRLRRALTWVEQASAAPLPTEQPCLTAPQPAAAPALAA